MLLAAPGSPAPGLLHEVDRLSRYRQGPAERHGPPTSSGVVIERAARAIAAAFGYGLSVLAPSGEPGHVFLLPALDEPDTGGLDGGLSISKVEKAVQTSRGYLPTTPGRRERALAEFPVPLSLEQRAQVEAFDQQANMRKNGDPYRVRQFKPWDNRHAGMVVATTRPRRTILQALSVADLRGPLADWLLLYATQDIARWPKVERYMVACGHPDWAAAEAAARMLGTRRPWEEVAREQMMRKGDCRQVVLAAERRLQSWLERASRALWEAME